MKNRDHEQSDQPVSLLLNVDIFSEEFDDDEAAAETNQNADGAAEGLPGGSPPDSEPEGDPAFRLDLEEGPEETHIHQVKREFNAFMRTPFYKQFTVSAAAVPPKLSHVDLKKARPSLNNLEPKARPKNLGKLDRLAFAERPEPAFQAKPPKLGQPSELKERLKPVKQLKPPGEPKTRLVPGALGLKDSIAKPEPANQTRVNRLEKSVKTVIKKKTSPVKPDVLIIERPGLNIFPKPGTRISLTNRPDMDMSFEGCGNNPKNNRLQLGKIWDKNE